MSLHKEKYSLTVSKEKDRAKCHLKGKTKTMSGRNWPTWLFSEHR